MPGVLIKCRRFYTVQKLYLPPCRDGTASLKRAGEVEKGVKMKREFTTLCYLQKDGKWLMLYRNKKKNDINAGKYIGVGGHVEDGESPDECIVREVFEETGYRLTDYRARGLITFVMNDVVEYTVLYTADDFEGEEKICDEGDLVWVEADRVLELPLWEGDRAFLCRLRNTTDFLL